jgi:hypothetical protein
LKGEGFGVYVLLVSAKAPPDFFFSPKRDPVGDPKAKKKEKKELKKE